MKLNKKTMIIVGSIITGLALICGIFCFAFHQRHEGRGFSSHSPCGSNSYFSRGRQATMMSGMEAIINNKDYAGFQKLVSGSRMAEIINTPEKFATRIELQTTMEKVQDLTSKLGSGTMQKGYPMMFGPAGEKRGKIMKQSGRFHMQRR